MIAEPLSRLLKKIHKAILDTVLHTDAIMEGYGAMLLQKYHDKNQLHSIHSTKSKRKHLQYNTTVWHRILRDEAS